MTRPFYWVVFSTGRYRKYVAVQIKYAPMTFTDPWGTRVGIVGIECETVYSCGAGGKSASLDFKLHVLSYSNKSDEWTRGPRRNCSGNPSEDALPP